MVVAKPCTYFQENIYEKILIILISSLQLAVSPSSKSSHEPILVNVDSQLALKVEGLIEDKQNAGIILYLSFYN